MTVLRVIVDQVLAPIAGGIGRYAEELTRELIATAPKDVAVEAVVSAVDQDDIQRLETLLPGLARVERLALPRRELSLAWQNGVGVRAAGQGMVHAPSVLAPLGKHNHLLDPGHQTVATVHDTVPWTHPHTMTPHGVHFHKAMVRRAYKYADAVVVPTHAVAAELNEIHRFEDRLRVIGGAPSSRLSVPVDAALRAERLGLPAQYILSVGTLEPRKGLRHLVDALAHPDAPDLPLVVSGPDGWGDVDLLDIAEQAGLEPGRVKLLGRVDDTDLAVAYDRAAVFVFPSLAEGFGLPVIEAMHFGTPVIHSDAPAVREVASDAGVTVSTTPIDSYSERLAQAMFQVVNDQELARRLAIAGPDRARMFTWHDSALETWQLHADL